MMVLLDFQKKKKTKLKPEQRRDGEFLSGCVCYIAMRMLTRQCSLTAQILFCSECEAVKIDPK